MTKKKKKGKMVEILKIVKNKIWNKYDNEANKLNIFKFNIFCKLN
jgi:hypothetical protein